MRHQKTVVIGLAAALLAFQATACAAAQQGVRDFSSSQAGSGAASAVSSAVSLPASSGQGDSSSTAASAVSSVQSAAGNPSPSGESSGTSEKASAGVVIYRNTQYTFTFDLPKDWKGYAVVRDKWTGNKLTSAADGVPLTGPLLSLRNPKWTSADPYQDIPILIFTMKQWNALKSGAFSIGAAPRDPEELARNADYVYALPARWDISPQTGIEEVRAILSGNPLHPEGQIPTPAESVY